MTEPGRFYGFRDELAARLRRDVLGPVGDVDEVLDEEPATAYIAGVLFPPPRDDEAEDTRRDEEDVDLAPSTLAVDELPDTGVSMANRQMPSAMGLTFAVDTTVATSVTITVRAAAYEAIDEHGRPVVARRSERRSSDGAGLRWRRRPLPPTRVPVDVLGAPPPVVDIGEGGLELRLRLRPADAAGVVTVTATLVNARTPARNDLVDPYCFFQPELHVEGGSDVLVDRMSTDLGALTGADVDELAVSRLVHRHAPMFAVGHGCAVDWDWDAPDARGARSTHRAGTDAVWTTFVPTREVLLTESNPDVAEPSMLALARDPAPEVIARLTALVEGYRAWIAERRVDARSLTATPFAKAADDQLDACTEACDRMERGVERLRTDPAALTAFRLANEAMAAQRARTAWIREGMYGEPDLTVGRWRPFQIGFLLLCLDGIVDDRHEDRRLADVLWFPTGGGKTEAYLGLIAFTTFLRRIRLRERGAGVTVLMRYTLRLLTLQQFERAATLICAMERMRDEQRELLGVERISIGMWVGRAATPNTLKEAAESLAELAKGKQLQEKNPVQLRSCPWCGTPMDHHDHHVDLDRGTMSITCRNGTCRFRSGLPVHLVDEDIYAQRPTLIIATADKFAQIAWRDRVAGLFNREGALEGTPPPELIIQDELHLISGPLGTLAGLYETAIDIAADRPKVIASTATIRRAQQQGAALFDREVRQFPPAGLDARDSWFAVEASREAKPSRLYLGLLTPSTSQATLLIRTAAALLHHAARLDGDDRVRDPYWTLVGYFNSLRLLSAAELQVHADVDERLKQLAHRDGVPPREIANLRELTSRVESSEVPRRLGELFVALPDEAAIDVVLATNMISVGVDVDRLGLMTVMGQPQTTAEYIQATSRVGRRFPGLVVTLLNAARSRDRSHYENFVAYHSALYRQVESTSVTPFASRSRDRALHAVLVGLTRLLHPVARPNAAAARVDEFGAEVQAVRSAILDRVTAVAPHEREATEEELDRFIDDWERLAEGNPLVYEAPRRKWAGERRSSTAALLRSFEQDDDLDEATDTMWSLRDVDVESDLYLEI